MTDPIFDVPVPPRPADVEARTAALLAALGERILVLDGATGTALQGVDLTADDFGGPELEGCNENLCATRPDVVDGVHEGYLAAGCDIVETNSFGGTPLVLAEYGLADKAYELNAASAAHRPRGLRPARHAGAAALRLRLDGADHQGDLGHRRHHLRGADRALPRPGPRPDGRRRRLPAARDRQDTRNIKAGLLGIERAFAQAGWKVPVAVSATIETTGTMLAGQDAEALAVSLLHADLLYVGLNCATGPELMTDHLRTLSEICRTRVACVPNAGLPDEEGLLHRGAGGLRRASSPASSTPAGSTWSAAAAAPRAAHVAALARAGRGPAARGAIPHHRRCLVSGLEAVELTDDNRPLLVGERTNVLGSRKFKRLIQDGQYEAAAEVGRAQVRAGARSSTSASRTRTATRSRDMEALPRPADPHGQGAADDRLDRRRGHGARAHLLPGQVGPQLDQPGGRPLPASRRSCRWRGASAPRWSSA